MMSKGVWNEIVVGIGLEINCLTSRTYGRSISIKAVLDKLLDHRTQIDNDLPRLDPMNLEERSARAPLAMYSFVRDFISYSIGFNGLNDSHGKWRLRHWSYRRSSHSLGQRPDR